MTSLMLLILIVLVLGVIVIAALLEPVNSGNGYWFSVAWGIFLLILNWYSSAAIFSGSKSDRDGTPGNLMGSLPGISLGIFAYSIASITFLVLNRSDILGSSLHLVFQVISAMIIITITLLSLIAAKAQRSGAESTVSQTELLNSLKAFERSLGEDSERSKINEIIDYVAYRMPHTSKLNGVELQKIHIAICDECLGASERIMEAKRLLRL